MDRRCLIVALKYLIMAENIGSFTTVLGINYHKKIIIFKVRAQFV